MFHEQPTRFPEYQDGKTVNGVTEAQWHARMVEMSKANAKLEDRSIGLKLWTCNHINYVVVDVHTGKRVGSIGRCYDDAFNAERDDMSGCNSHVAVAETLHDAVVMLKLALKKGHLYGYWNYAAQAYTEAP